MKYDRWLPSAAKDLPELLHEAQTVSIRNFGTKIKFYAPSFAYYKTEYYCSSPTAFPSISITGSACSLGCKHCNGIVLKTMHPACSPEKLLDLCRQLQSDGAVGCLISGGCLPDGSVPIRKFMGALAQIKRELGLTVIVHTGIIDDNVAEQLKQAGVDAALIDIIGSNETINEIYHLDTCVADYEKSLQALQAAGIPTVPHVLVGLHYGRLKGELNALKIIAEYNPAAVIIIAFMPIRGTPMETVTPPPPTAIGKVLAIARLMMPATPLVLGCMRPQGVHRVETDVLAVKAGVNAIAFPTEDAIRLAESIGYDVSFSSYCCSQIFEDLRNGSLAR